MFRQIPLIVCCLAFPGDDGKIDAESTLPTDRVQTVRKLYAQLPSQVLDIAEPVTLESGDFLFDGGTMFVILEDANGKRFSATLDGRAKGPFPAKFKYSRLQIGNANRIGSGKPRLLRGPEEAALYGLLIRWSRTKKLKRPDDQFFAKSNLFWADRVLVALDFQFCQASED